MCDSFSPVKFKNIKQISRHSFTVDSLDAKIGSAKRSKENDRYGCSIRNGEFFAEQIQQKTDGSANDDPFRQVFYLKRVAADVVSLDSELPLKSRDAITTATGSIPKLGLKLYLTEKQMKDLDAMIATNTPSTQVLQKMFEDVPRVIEAIYERIEDIFLSEFSTGVGLSTRSNGTGVRIDVKYKTENQFAALVATWAGNPDTATPIADIQQVYDKAEEDGNVISDLYLDDYALRALGKCKEMKEKYAFISDFSGNNIPALNFNKLQAVFQDEWNTTLHRPINRKVRTELNGVQATHTPWAQGRLVFACDGIVGDLVWTDVMEMTRPVPGVVYQTADEFILASQYAKNDPYREFTSSQAMVVPIISSVDRIYTLDPKTVSA